MQVLGYVTPWNNDGYTVSETFGAKFSFISPVWYQLRSEEGDKVVLTGGHDVSQKTAHFTSKPIPSLVQDRVVKGVRLPPLHGCCRWMVDGWTRCGRTRAPR